MLTETPQTLFRAWEFLLLELNSGLSARAPVLSKQMWQVAEQCLTANTSTQGPERIFDSVRQSRADLALMLIQRLMNTRAVQGGGLQFSDVSKALNAVWGVMDALDNPFGKDHIAYYRTLQRTLYVTLRGLASTDVMRLGRSSMGPDGAAGKRASVNGGTSAALATSQTVLNILDRAVAKGFRTLVSLIHDPEISVMPEDLTLLTAILQACLSLPDMEQCHTQILNIMSSYDVLHVATSLFSWSHKLAASAGKSSSANDNAGGGEDPVYAELSILFLLELSSVPVVAEQLACDGLLAQISTAQIANVMRRSKIVGPFADSAVAQRCYSVWARALLPLLLNLLTALGQSVAPEVAYLLNQFPGLMRAATDRFDAPSTSRTGGAGTGQQNFLALVAIEEASSLAMLTRILEVARAQRAREVPEVEWDGAGLLENVEYWLSSRRMLRERLIPLGARESEWRVTKSAVQGCETLLEERAIRGLEGLRAILSEDWAD